MTFLEAALQILRREGKPLHYKDITERAINKKLLTFVGRTPEVTMQTQLTAAVKKTPGNPFVRVKPGVFGLLRYPELGPDELEAESPSPSNGAEEAVEAGEGGTDARGRRRRRSRRGGRSGREPSSPSASGTSPAVAGATTAATAAPAGRRAPAHVLESADEATEDAATTGLQAGHETDDLDEPDVGGGGLSAEDRAAALAEFTSSDHDEDDDDDQDDDDDGDEDQDDDGDESAESSAGDPDESDDDDDADEDDESDDEDDDDDGDEDRSDDESDEGVPNRVESHQADERPRSSAATTGQSGEGVSMNAGEREPSDSAPSHAAGQPLAARGDAPAEDLDSDDEAGAEGDGEDDAVAGAGPDEAGGFGRRRRRRRRRRRGGENGLQGAPGGAAGEGGEEPAATPRGTAEGSDAPGAQADAQPPVAEAAPTASGQEAEAPGTSAGPGGRRITAPIDAAIEILRGQPPGRGVHVRQIADAAVRRRLIHGEPHEAWRVIRAALASEPKERLRAGQRPRVRPAGTGLYALARRPNDLDLEKSEYVFGEARRALRERTLASLEQRLAELAPGAFEAIARVTMQREGFGPATFVKRVEGTVYLEVLRGRGFKPSKTLVALRSGGGTVGRRAVGELRAGVRARNQDEGMLLLAGRLGDDAIAEWKQAGPPVEVVDGPALAEACVRHGIGVVNAMVSVDFVDADFFAELAEG